jgi:hypothetical protein
MPVAFFRRRKDRGQRGEAAEAGVLTYRSDILDLRGMGRAKLFGVQYPPIPRT